MVLMESIAEKSQIASNPQVCGGRPCIAGTRIRVQDIYVCHELRGMSPDQFVAAYPRLTLADVHAALAYYFDHKDQIRKDMIDEGAFVTGIRAMTGPRSSRSPWP
jgi:uncharacterized protein (DUF433 family)